MMIYIGSKEEKANEGEGEGGKEGRRGKEENKGWLSKEYERVGEETSYMTPSDP